MIKPMLIQGGIHSDERGALAFVNSFGMEAVRRFYLIRHSDTRVIRAWQGHRTEEKWFFPVARTIGKTPLRTFQWSDLY